MPVPLPLVVVTAIFFGSTGDRPTPLRETRPDKFPRPQEEPVRPGNERPPSSRKPRFFGVGVGFQTSGTLAGVAVNIVLPDSPASRAGIVPGCIISEINGEPTAGRAGEDCARLIKDASSKVKIKYLDPALKEKVLFLEKEWLNPPD